MGKQLRAWTLELRWKILALLALFFSLWTLQHLTAQGWGDFDISNRCVELQYDVEVRCDFIDGLICVNFWFPSTEQVECNQANVEFNAEVVPGFPLVATAQPSGWLYTYCFYPESMKDSLCYVFTYDGVCCDIKGCTDIPPRCCQYRSHVQEGDLQCRALDGQTRYTKRFSFQPSDSAFLCNNFDVVLDPPIPADVDVLWVGYSYSVEVQYDEADIPPGTEAVCITVDFDNPLCCDFTVCDSLNQCCDQDMEWALRYERIECKRIRDGFVVKEVPCFDIAIDLSNSIAFCDTPDFFSNIPLIDGSYSEGFENDGLYHFKGCLDTNSTEGDVFCYKLDFPYAPPDLVCCDIQRCLKLPDCGFDIVVSDPYCDEEPPSRLYPQGRKFYCVQFRIDGGQADRVQCGVLVHGNWIPADKCEVVYDSNGTLITSCIDTTSIPSGLDSIEWAIQFRLNKDPYSFVKAVPIPICCIRHGYDIQVWCDTSSNDSFNYCFRLEVYNWRGCGRWLLGGNTVGLDYDATFTPQGNLVIEGCFENFIIAWVDGKPINDFYGVCFALTSDNPNCCPLKICVPFERSSELRKLYHSRNQ